MPSARERGFALLITVTLVAFLVLLLVAMATLTRVETQVATNSQQQARARQNALMALNLAIGQLQKYAGPDQRVTAKADLTHAPGQPNAHWTGVYGSTIAADYNDDPVRIATDLTTAANIHPQTGSPARLLNWLVSGNECTAFDPRRTTGDVGPAGNITAAIPSVEFTPASLVNNLTAGSTSTDTNLQILGASGAVPARLLVGGNSVTSTLDASGRPVDYVVAPLVDITANTATVPGADPGGGNVTIGRYAWWIGDEGVKARANLPLAGTDPALTASEKLEQQRNAFSNATRAAIELMTLDDDPALDGDRIGILHDPGHAVLTPILAPSQIPLASVTPASMAAALQHRFHDITTYSVSVLSDTYVGGLKRDLSILLDKSHSPASADPSADGKRLWTPHPGDDGTGNAFAAGFAIPTWHHLRTYAQTRIPTTGVNAFSLPVTLPAHDKPAAADPDHVGVAPVITYFSVGWRATPTAPSAPGVEIHMNLYPLVVLWNPYNFTLKAPPAAVGGGNFEVGVNPAYKVRVELEVRIPAETSNENTGEPESQWVWEPRARFDFQRTYSSDFINFIRFRLDCPDIPPGQSLVFSLPASSSGNVYTQRNILKNIEPESGAYVSVPFRSGPAHNPIIITVRPGEENLLYRVSASPGDLSNSFRGAGALDIYLGEPNPAAAVYCGDINAFNPSAANRRWYNTAQEMDWSGTVAMPPFQEDGPLVYDPQGSEPAYVFQTQALFAGKGSNAQFNTNQYMFATRWIAQGNMRAVRSGRTRRDNNFNVLFTATAGQPLYDFPWQKFLDGGPGGDNRRASAGLGHDWQNGAPVDVTLFEFPYENQPLQSIGQLQHANLSLVGAYPAYPVGNSLADFRLVSGGSSFSSNPAPPGWQLVRVDAGTGANGVNRLGANMRGYYDISWLLNRNLWDRHYFSTIPATGTVPPLLPNPRHLRRKTGVDLQNADHSAAGLMLAGGFNINSTSEQAWRAVLGGGNQLAFDPQTPDSASTTPFKTAFPRFTRPAGDDDPDDAWRGYRTLDENQIAQLARNVVEQVRNRGPFVSLADFINRRLVDNPATTAENETWRGTLQAALDATNTATTSSFPANDGDKAFWAEDELITSNHRVNQTTQYDMGYYGRPQLEGRRNPADAAQRPYGGRSAFAPKYITQADILAKIGSGLTARSDTFTIRAYGETVNPATLAPSGRAWCEAVVQRIPDYVEDAVNPWDTPAADTASQTFGRRFKIVSFRWLSSDDI